MPRQSTLRCVGSARDCRSGRFLGSAHDGDAESLRRPVLLPGVLPTAEIVAEFLPGRSAWADQTSRARSWVRSGCRAPWSSMPMARRRYVQCPRPMPEQHRARRTVAANYPSVNLRRPDNDGNGFVDAFIVVHAGPAAEVTGSPNDIWSHKWVYRAARLNTDGPSLRLSDRAGGCPRRGLRA